jgi:hypothetical protein
MDALRKSGENIISPDTLYTLTIASHQKSAIKNVKINPDRLLQGAEIQIKLNQKASL